MTDLKKVSGGLTMEFPDKLTLDVKSADLKKGIESTMTKEGTIEASMTAQHVTTTITHKLFGVKV